MSPSIFSAIALLSAAPLASALAAGLELVDSVDLATQGIFISADGRKFLTQRYSTGLSIELLADNTTVLYPGAAWNSYNATKSSSDPMTTFVNIGGARFWVVDGGSTGVANS